MPWNSPYINYYKFINITRNEHNLYQLLTTSRYPCFPNFHLLENEDKIRIFESVIQRNDWDRYDHIAAVPFHFGEPSFDYEYKRSLTHHIWCPPKQKHTY